MIRNIERMSEERLIVAQRNMRKFNKNGHIDGDMVMMFYKNSSMFHNRSYRWGYDDDVL